MKNVGNSILSHLCRILSSACVFSVHQELPLEKSDSLEKSRVICDIKIKFKTCLNGGACFSVSIVVFVPRPWLQVLFVCGVPGQVSGTSFHQGIAS